MPKLSVISGKKLVRVLGEYGFYPARSKGSHVFIKHGHFSVSTVIPVHANEDLGKGLLISILRDLKIEQDDFLLMLKKNKTAAEILRLDRHYSH